MLLARRRRIGSRELDIAGPSLVVVLGRNPIAVSLRAARQRRIPVRTIPHPGAMAVADHALALLLAVARRLVEGDRGVRAGAYRERGLSPRTTTERSFAFNWLGRDDAVLLDGRRLGLVGFGAIGPGGGPPGRRFRDAGLLFPAAAAFRGLEPAASGRLPPPPSRNCSGAPTR